MRSFGIVLAMGLVAWASDVQAGRRHCDHCGCRQECKKVCRLVHGTKKETKTEYGCECEDFCVPGRSRKCGVKCDCDAHGHKYRHIVWQPTCAEVRTRKKLVKKDISKEVPDDRWVVEEICRGCGRCLGRTEPSDAPSLARIADDAEFAPASDQVALEPALDEAEPDAYESEPDADEAEPADREAFRPQIRRPSRFFQSLLGVK
ncbi:MAG TPA: hypothetical protein VMV69_18255 [Pirellulales bacterium]|nr:hypothetical protein [Pirellulales bacterium]